MSAAAPTVDATRAGTVRRHLAALRRNSWTLGLLVFLAILLVFTRLIQPTYGPTGIQGLANSVLPLALAATAQAIVVISGGIDLSIGSMMALTSVVAASNMQNQSDQFAVVVVIGVLLLGLLLGAVNGAVIVVTRVPDIVVTLAMAFVWAGCALLVLKTPGGGSAQWLNDLVLGPLGNEWIPKAGVLLVVIVAVIWIPVSRSRLGLSLYAIGSNQLAAFRSGVSVGRTKIFAYMLGGLFSALGGLALTASTGQGHAGSRAVHAVERRRDRARWCQPGRRSRRGVRTPDRRRHPAADPNRHDVPEAGPEPRDGRPGGDPDRRGHARQPASAAQEPGMSGAVGTAEARNPWLTAAAWRALFRDRPVIPLLVLLGLLVILFELGPSSVNLAWAGGVFRAAVPLAILAGCQTLAMLTGGIDLSVGAIASASGFVVATLVADHGSPGRPSSSCSLRPGLPGS